MTSGKLFFVQLALLLLMAPPVASGQPVRAGEQTGGPPGAVTGVEPRIPSRTITGSLSGWEWWKDGEVKKRLSLSDDVERRIDAIFRQRSKAIAPFVEQLRKDLEELERFTRERTTDEMAYAVQVNRVEALRSRINETRLVMLYRMYLELTSEQYKRLQEFLNNRLHQRGRE